MNTHPSRLAKKTTSLFNRGFSIVFFILFFLIAFFGNFVLSIHGELGIDNFQSYMMVLRYLTLTLSFVGIGALLIAAYKFIHSDRCMALDQKRINTTVLLVGIGAMLVIQLLCAFTFRMSPVTDVKQVEKYAFQILQDNSFDCIKEGFNKNYIIKYQNNLAYLFIMTLLYKISYLITGAYSQVVIIITNTIAINVSILFTVLTARRIFDNRKAVFTLLMCALFTPYYTYTAYYYTDTISLPIVTGVVYMFVCATQSKNRNVKATLLLLCGTLIALGYKIKGSVAILLPAVLIYLLLQFGIKRALKTAVPLLLGFVILFTSYTAILNSTDIIPKETSDRYQYPLTHWVMMGLKGIGAYNSEDSAYTASFTSKAEKTEANIEEIKNRISEKGFFGMAYHLGYKARWTWMDGTYYVGYYLVDYHNHSFLHDFVLYDGQYRFWYYALASGMQLLIIFMMAYSGLCATRKKNIDLVCFLRIAIVGIFIFLLMWETNSRYPFNFTPLYLLVATDGIINFAKRNKTE